MIKSRAELERLRRAIEITCRAQRDAMKQTHPGIAEYEIEDGENKYVFYTLYQNRDKLWGRKQFKADPLAVDTKPEKE